MGTAGAAGPLRAGAGRTDHTAIGHVAWLHSRDAGVDGTVAWLLEALEGTLSTISHNRVSTSYRMPLESSYMNTLTTKPPAPGSGTPPAQRLRGMALGADDCAAPRLRVLLQGSAEQQQRLTDLRGLFTQACNALAPMVQQTRCWNRVALHHMAYKPLRETE